MHRNPTDEEEDLQKPDQITRHLTARELQVRGPARGAITDAESLRGDRGLPETRTDKMLKKGAGRKPKG